MNNETKLPQPSAELPSGTVTFLFTDIEGSTELLKQLGEGYKSLLADQRRILRDVFARWNGREVDTQGDAFFVSFPRATEAVNAAVEAQRCLDEHTWPEDVKVQVRMGLHTGEPWSAEEGYVGMDVHRAARIAHVGHGGQVLLSETTTALILDDLPEGVSILDLGSHLLKDLPRPEHIRQLVLEELPSDFPPLTSLEKLPSIELREPRSVGECPYRGLSAFREKDAPFFYGRETFAERMYEAVSTQPIITVIMGSSGSGKSSAVFAGLMPRLQEDSSWVTAVFRPRGKPFHSLAVALVSLLESDLRGPDQISEAVKLAERISDGEIDLVQVIERILDQNPSWRQLLIVIDQFEELYTLSKDVTLQRRFTDVLLKGVEEMRSFRAPSLVLLLTMRADFLEQALMHRPFADVLQDASLILGPMTREELRMAIEKPAELQGAEIEPGLVERLLDDVGEEPGNLPLLEFALTLLWERQDDGWLTHDDYEAIGCVDGALASYADDVYARLSEEDREGARQIFIQLVQPGDGKADTRRVATSDEIGREKRDLVVHLADKRLVVTGRDKRTGEEIVEVAHEALIQHWSELQEWMEEDRVFRAWQERLRAALQEWEESGHDEGALLRGVPLHQAENWLEKRISEMKSVERDFIHASVLYREQVHAHRNRRRRRTVVGLAVGTVIALILSLLAGLQWKRAEVEEYEALRQASIGLAALAVDELETASPERSVLLALEALEHYPYTGSAESALAQAVQAYHDYVTLPNEEMRISDAVWSPDGDRIVVVSIEGLGQIWDSNTGEEFMRFGERDFSDLHRAAWFADGTRIATASHALHTGQVWDAESGVLLMTFNGHTDVVNTITPTRDGRFVVTASADGTARVWDVGTGDERLILGGQLDAVMDARWSRREDRILTASMDGTVRVWDANTGIELLSLDAHTGGALSATWSPDGTHIASSGIDGALRTWDALSGELIFTFIGHDRAVHDVDWSPDGRRIATAGGDSTVRVWDARIGDELLRLRGMSAPQAVAWSPSGERLVAAEGTFAIRIWDVSQEVIRLGQIGVTADAQWSPDMAIIATAGEGSLVRIMDFTTSDLLMTFTGHVLDETRWQASWFFSWSPTGELIVTTGEDHAARIWDPYSGAEHYAFLHEEFFIPYADWSPDGTHIATGTYNPPAGSPIYIWDVETKDLLNTFGHECFVTEPSWSPDGTRIVSECSTETSDSVVVWDVATGGQILQFTEHTGAAVRPHWSPDGTRIVSGSFDTTVRIWDAVTGEEYLVYPGHTATVYDAEWSPDGVRIASGDEDGFLHIWNAETGEEVYRFEVSGGIIHVEWSSDGKYVIVGGSTNVPEIRRVWKSTAELIAYAKECCVFRELTAEERAQFGLPLVETLE
ncbi:MAG: hypothetical protein GTO14_23265 [Anaerolineales bacterium]|nr:hypothetical protein [Anaerolineales bacterium]